MNEKNVPFTFGSKIIEFVSAANTAIDLRQTLGPLYQLIGTWENVGQATVDSDHALGWNVIAVPGPGRNGGPGEFILEVIPYKETLTFSPVVAAGNRGVYTGGSQAEQQLNGLIYRQIVTSLCDSPTCQKMGFPSGSEIHAETGIILYVKDCVANDGTTNCNDATDDIARLATIPHGNSVLAMGASSTKENPGNDFFAADSTVPTPVNKGDQLMLAYTDPYTRVKQFQQFNQQHPNTFLQQTLVSQKQVIKSMTTLTMSTTNSSGGILNIPFTKTDVRTLNMDATFWIQEIEGADALQLQYTQTINLIFPGNSMRGTPVPVQWPHVTLNTLTQTSKTA